MIESIQINNKYMGSIWQPLDSSNRPVFGVWFAGKVGFPIKSGAGRHDFPTREAAVKALKESNNGRQN